MDRSRGGAEHAIVIGGGIAGLLSAAILSHHYRRVTLYERDTIPYSAPTIRPGAPQGHHVHVLLSRGWRILDAQLPGLDRRLDDAGARPFDWSADVVWETPWGRTPREPSPLRSRLCSRALLEHAIRAELRENHPRITVREGYEVAGLQALGNPPQVVGVVARGRSPDRPPLSEADLQADLVVDTSGRSSRAPAWLAALGFGEPPETVIDAHLGYSSRIYRRRPGVDWRALYVMNRAPNHPRSGVVYEIEGDRWQVTLVGYGGDYPPTDEAGFLAFAEGLAKPAVAEALRGAEPLGKIHGYRRTENRVRHFERLPHWPAGFLVLGDAACALNPVYGQGMTVAAIAATVLDTALCDRLPPERLGPVFQRRLAASLRSPFTTATNDDLRWPTTSGHAPPGLRLVHRLVDRVFAAATSDPRIHRTLLEVLHMLRPTSALLRPWILGPALFSASR